MDFIWNIGLYHFLTTSLILFFTGVFGVIFSGNLLRILISLEIIFCGVILNVVTLAVYCDNIHIKGIIFAFFILLLSAINITVAMAIVLNIYKFRGSLDIQEIKDLKE